MGNKPVLVSNSHYYSGIGAYTFTLKRLFGFEAYLFKMKPWERDDYYDRVVYYPPHLVNMASLVVDRLFNVTFSRHVKGRYVHSVVPDYSYVAKVAKATIVTVHDIFPLKKGEQYRYYPWYYRLWFKMGVHSLEDADAVVTVSNTTKTELEAYAKEHGINLPDVHTIYHTPKIEDFGVEKEKAKKVAMERGLIPDRECTVVLNVAHDEPRKNLKVVERLKEFKDLCVVTVNNSRGEVSHYHLGSYDMYLLYRSADVYFTPSIDEGFGLPIIEALRVTTPVVSSDIPAHREIYEVQRYGMVLFDLRSDMEEIHEKILKAVDMTDFKLAKEFMPETFYTKYKKIYEKYFA